jgi:RimJ/RimL family protein N-acetyltransferase
VLVEGRDEEFHRWLGEGAAEPRPTACIEVGGEIVGWVDADASCDWLAPGEVNVGYHVFAAHRGNGYATRAVALLVRGLASGVSTAVLLIDDGNARSLAVARRAGFVRDGSVGGQQRWVHPTVIAPNSPR